MAKKGSLIYVSAGEGQLRKHFPGFFIPLKYLQYMGTKRVDEVYNINF